MLMPLVYGMSFGVEPTRSEKRYGGRGASAHGEIFITPCRYFT